MYYNIFNVIENKDTPSIVKEKIDPKNNDNSSPGIYFAF